MAQTQEKDLSDLTVPHSGVRAEDGVSWGKVAKDSRRVVTNGKVLKSRKLSTG